MRKILIFLLLIGLPATAAPLFPDVPDQHWVQDAVAKLAARGLVEGYPDGTFKGDRATSRWELAMMVARLLQKMEGRHSTFATRAELQEIGKLAEALREELDALGIRVTDLEEKTALLDRRVTELERITFYGQLDARVVVHSFANQGASDNDSGRNGGGLAGGLPFVNYGSSVGSVAPGLFRPQVNGVLPVMDYNRGRVLNNGTGFTSRGLLGLKIKVAPEVDAGLELVGFSSQGDRFIDGYWGLNGPYTAHVGSGNVGGGPVQSLDHTPFTRMVLDRFWIEHKGESSGTKVVVGNLYPLKIPQHIYLGQANANLEGPGRLNFGFSVDGHLDFDEQNRLIWEVFNSRIGSRNLFLGTNYDHRVVGADLGYSFQKGLGKVHLGFARLFDESLGGATLNPGLLGFNNVAYGASGGWSPFQWVNPPGYFAAQRSLFEQANTGQGFLGTNGVDTRPIAGWNGAADNAIGLAAGGGNYGPQSQNTYGLEASYRWVLNPETEITTSLEYGRSQYRPNRNSSYESQGDLLHLSLEGSGLDGALDFDLRYLSVDPNYNPARFRNGLVGARFPSVFNVVGAFHTHDINVYPFNREGFRAGLNWNFDDDRGMVWGNGEWLDQKRTSLYDVRVLPGAVGPGTPNFPVIGYSPGFIDYVFAGYAHPNQYGANSANSFNAALAPLEDPKGRQNSYTLGARYHWREPDLKITGSHRWMDFRRNSRLSPQLGGSQNQVNMKTQTLHFEVAWRANPEHLVSLGLDRIRVHGHHDPGGLYNAYAQRIGSTRFDNIDSVQTSPYVSFDWDLNQRTQWNLTLRHFDTVDGIGPQVTAGRAFDTVGSSVHPFDWSGWQMTTQLSTKF